MTLDRLALSRSALDRAAHRRTEPGLLDRLLATASTAVLVLDVDRAPVSAGPGGVGLLLLDPAAALEFTGTAWPDGEELLPLYLGEDTAGRSHVVLARLRSLLTGGGSAPRPPQAEVEPPGGTSWAGLREVGTVLDDADAGLLTAAVALSHWHAGHPRCPRCGEPTEVIQAGWARSCPACGVEHYPRTDAAVIMTITDADDRILLGRQAGWPERRFSCLAGFVEPGESLEAAVRREVLEETGVVVGDVRYLGSQPWPFPASLMLGFSGRALTTGVNVDGAELATARWWSREELALDIATGEVVLPPAVSIARRLVETWFGGPIRDGGVAWR